MQLKLFCQDVTNTCKMYQTVLNMKDGMIIAVSENMILILNLQCRME